MPRTFAARLVPAVALVLAIAGRLPAGVVVLSNATGQAVEFRLKTAGKEQAERLAAGETRPFPCGPVVEVRFAAAAKPATFRLEPYSAYVFVSKKDAVELHGIELPGKAPPGVVTYSDPGELRVSVKLLVDDAERRTRPAWEPALRRRVEQAAEVVRAHTGVSFEVVAVDEWPSNPRAVDLKEQFADFEKEVKPTPAALAIGYTSRRLGPADAQPAGVFAVGRGAMHPYILIRESEPRTESERVEVLIQQLGKYLGAVPSPDPSSAMRPRLGDGKAAIAKFRLGFDPLNTLAMSIWAEELRGGRVKSPDDLSAASQARLARVYGGLSAAMPDDPLPGAYLAMLGKAGIGGIGRPDPPLPVAPPPAAPPQVAKLPADPPQPERVAPVLPDPAPQPPRVALRPEREVSPKERAIREVVRAVAVRAADNARQEGGRVRGDELTALYVKTAADVAALEEKELQATAFLVGLGIALDDSTILRDNPFTASLCRAVESDDERRRRVAVLGNPTVRFRRDLCQHFAVSAALTEIAGPAMAEQAGLAKELIDMARPSGFSFSDLCADLAGIEFAKRVKRSPGLLESLKARFRVADFVPPIDGLSDGLSAEKFREAFGGLEDAKFRAAYDDVRKRVLELGAYAGEK